MERFLKPIDVKSIVLQLAFMQRTIVNCDKKLQ